MTFKFGVFVLLLLLDNSVAKQRLPRNPTDSHASSLQQVPNDRQDVLRTDHSPIQGLLWSSFRSSFASGEATCAWDKLNKKCLISISSMKQLLKKSHTEYAKMLIERLACAEKKNYTDCDKEKSCQWNYVLKGCEYKDIRRNHEDSPCTKVAPLYIDNIEAHTQCLKESSGKRCKSNSLCQWNSDDQYCSVDEYFIFYGIKNFTEKYIQIEDSVQAILEAQYSALQSSSNFTWESLLNYKPSSIECPSGIEQLVCDFVVTSLSNDLRSELYCSEKYKSAVDECEADDLCWWYGRLSKCMGDEVQLQTASHLIVKRVLVASMLEGPDKKIQEAKYTCPIIFESKDCKGNCIWNPNIRSCEIRKDYIAALLTKPENNTTDGLCMYLETDGFSRCHTQFSKRKCERDKVCRWNSAYRCCPKEETFLSAAADEDPTLDRRSKRFKKQCWSHTIKDECAM